MKIKMSLMDGWKKFEELQMKRDMMMANINTQREILDIHKAMWDKHSKNNSVNMLTIRNINKIVGKTLPISNTRMHTLAMGRIEDVYEWTDNRYEFRIKIETPNDTKQFYLSLNRNKIPYPIVLKDCWELSYEEKPNQYIVESIRKSELRDMGKVIGVLGNLVDRILNR